MKNGIKKIAVLLIFCMVLTGCGTKSEGTRVVLTTGFRDNEIFRIETISCTVPEIMVYLTTTQNQYESVFGEALWEKDLNGETLEQSIKETKLAQIAQIKTMNLLAAQKGVTLNEEELATVREAAGVYFDSLNETEKELLQIDEATIETMYAEYALADKVYENIIKDINPEISDDEARTITVQHILIKTYNLDGTGKKIEYGENEKEDAYKQALQIRSRAAGGEDFDELTHQYSEDEKSTYSFGKGDMEASFEEAAFNLEKGEISEVVETSFGYHIIKCINTFNREETDANKVKIVKQRREEVFGEEYDSFVASLTRDLNQELWGKVTFIHNADVSTHNFFEVYEDYFKQPEE